LKHFNKELSVKAQRELNMKQKTIPKRMAWLYA